MPAKRGDRAAPPARPGGWEARFATSEAAKGWEELCRVLDQWQYEVTAGGRIWYCPDEERRIVWVVAASPSHPKATE